MEQTQTSLQILFFTLLSIFISSVSHHFYPHSTLRSDEIFFVACRLSKPQKLHRAKLCGEQGAAKFQTNNKKYC